MTEKGKFILLAAFLWVTTLSGLAMILGLIRTPTYPYHPLIYVWIFFLGIAINIIGHGIVDRFPTVLSNEWQKEIVSFVILLDAGAWIVIILMLTFAKPAM